MYKFSVFLLLIIFVFVCFGQTKINAKSYLGENDRLSSKEILPQNIQINEDCIKDVAYESSNFISDAEAMMIEISGVTVSIKEVDEFGDKANKTLKDDGKLKFITRGAIYNDLQVLLDELLVNANINSGIKYKIHLLDDDMINSFTVGGHIYITTGIISFAKSRSAIAFVIGHEIGHNENGDLEMVLKKIKIANSMVEGTGDIGLALQQMLTPFYNQKNEIEADRFGVNISYQSGYNPNKGVELWKKIAEKENSSSIVGSFSRSHPYSIDRMNCLDTYITKNFNL